jgi:uncharacterized protein (DUF58 family)
MLWPNQRLVNLFLLPALLSLMVISVEGIWPVVAAIDGMILAVIVIDLLTLRGRRKWGAIRSVVPVMSIGKPSEVSLQLENRNASACAVKVVDFIPEIFENPEPVITLEVPGRKSATIKTRITALRRGRYRFETVQLLIGSRFGFWTLEKRLPCSSDVRVYPDIRQIAEYSMLARRDRLSILGVRKARRVGADNEFEQLRDYVIGDDPRDIDWRATARRHQLTVRAYQENQCQRLIFMIDTGRMMSGDLGDGLSPLDHVFNALILLSHVALLKGDQVGLMLFSDRLRVFLPPEGGPRQIGKIIHAIHDIDPEMVESRFEVAFSELRTRCRKRGLVVFITNLFDEFHGQWASESLTAIVGQHLPLAVFLRQADLFKLADSGPGLLGDGSVPAENREQLAAATAAADLLNDRYTILRRLRYKGAHVLDLEPQDLTANLINQYLELKAKQLI